jgi:hypothetical protein
MSSSSDDIQVVDPPTHAIQSRSASRTPARAGPSRSKAQIIVDVDPDSDSDDPIFLSETVGAKLAARFTFNDGTDRAGSSRSPALPDRSRSRSTSVAAGKKRKSSEKADPNLGQGEDFSIAESGQVKTDMAGALNVKQSAYERTKARRQRGKAEKAKSGTITESDDGRADEDSVKVKTQRKPRLGVNDVLLPMLNIEPPPVPDWLGQPVVLKQLSICPLCKRQLKQAESGPARWVSEQRRARGQMQELIQATYLYLLPTVIPTTKPSTGSPNGHQ